MERFRILGRSIGHGCFGLSKIVRNLEKTRAFRWRPATIRWRYGTALAAFVISASSRLALDAWLTSDRGFVLFLPATLIVTFFAGLGPAVLTSALSGIVLWYVFLPPFYSFGANVDGIVGLATFAFATTIGIALVHWLRVLIDRAEAERAKSEALAASVSTDLRGMTRLNELGNRLVREGKDVNNCLAGILDAAIAIAGANKGNVQLFDLDSGALIIAAQRGFHDFFLKYFEQVRTESSACAVAMRARQQIVVEDIRASSIFLGHPSQNVLLAEDVRAVISTPLTSGNGALLGMISVHFDHAHQPSEQQARLMNLLARQAADYLERKRAEQIEEILVREVQHRSNNLLAVVQAIANRSLSGEYSLTDAKQAFEARLHALARANRQLTTSNWSGVDLKEIVRVELEPFGERAIVEGIDVIVSPQHAQNLSLALHELATNAAKYGALSNATGKVMVSWTIRTNGDRSNKLYFKWQERFGPPVVAPARSGFGTSLLKAMFLNARFDYAVAGVTCEMEVLLEDRKGVAISGAGSEPALGANLAGSEANLAGSTYGLSSAEDYAAVPPTSAAPSD